MYRPSFFNTRTPVILQNEVTECGAACLAMILSHHGHLIDMLNLRKYMSITIKGTSLATISQTAQNFNLTARGLTTAKIFSIFYINMVYIGT